MQDLLAGGRRVEVKVVGDVGTGELDGVAAGAEDARDGAVGAVLRHKMRVGNTIHQILYRVTIQVVP